ncbi:hypothetical protein [Demequina aurantiaca]|uniref:hypothetical protein n=1 Tax=Demequina aurantiaca TaxID=676200 RepID=UPI0007806E30|nr:hypothetical protein [Demequina aurantiaca]
MAERTRVTPRQLLRRVGVVGLIAGPLLLIVGVAGAIDVARAEPGASSVAYQGVFCVAVILFGIIMLVHGILALRASSRLPEVARASGVNDFLKFAAVVVAVASGVAMIVLNEPLVAVIVALTAAAVVSSLLATGKALVATETGADHR